MNFAKRPIDCSVECYSLYLAIPQEFHALIGDAFEKSLDYEDL